MAPSATREQLNVYPGRVLADEVFLYKLRRAGTLNKPEPTIQRTGSNKSERYLEARRKVGRPGFAEFAIYACIYVPPPPLPSALGQDWAIGSGQEPAMAPVCRNLLVTFSATPRRYKAHRDTTHLPCTGTRCSSPR